MIKVDATLVCSSSRTFPGAFWTASDRSRSARLNRTERFARSILGCDSLMFNVHYISRFRCNRGKSNVTDRSSPRWPLVRLRAATGLAVFNCGPQCKDFASGVGRISTLDVHPRDAGPNPDQDRANTPAVNNRIKSRRPTSLLPTSDRERVLLDDITGTP